MNTDWSNKHGAIWWTTRGSSGEFLTHQESHYAPVMFNSPVGLKGYGWCMFSLSPMGLMPPRTPDGLFWLQFPSFAPQQGLLDQANMFAKVSLLWGILFCELCNILPPENPQSITTWAVTESSSERYFGFLIINCHHGSNNSNKTASATLVIIYWTRIMYQACLTNAILWYLFFFFFYQILVSQVSWFLFYT